jgi:hypothetical protein
VSQGDYRWLTVTAPEGSPDVEVVLEPNVNLASKSYQASLREQGIPITSFFSNGLDADYERLVTLGVTFTKELTDMPWGKFAILDETCGNLVQLQQVNFRTDRRWKLGSSHTRRRASCSSTARSTSDSFLTYRQPLSVVYVPRSAGRSSLPSVCTRPADR